VQFNGAVVARLNSPPSRDEIHASSITSERQVELYSQPRANRIGSSRNGNNLFCDRFRLAQSREIYPKECFNTKQCLILHCIKMKQASWGPVSGSGSQLAMLWVDSCCVTLRVLQPRSKFRWSLRIASCDSALLVPGDLPIHFARSAVQILPVLATSPVGRALRRGRQSSSHLPTTLFCLFPVPTHFSFVPVRSPPISIPMATRGCPPVIGLLLPERCFRRPSFLFRKKLCRLQTPLQGSVASRPLRMPAPDSSRLFPSSTVPVLRGVTVAPRFRGVPSVAVRGRASSLFRPFSLPALRSGASSLPRSLLIFDLPGKQKTGQKIIQPI
jgi:hypothetical protein